MPRGWGQGGRRDVCVEGKLHVHYRWGSYELIASRNVTAEFGRTASPASLGPLITAYHPAVRTQERKGHWTSLSLGSLRLARQMGPALFSPGFTSILGDTLLFGETGREKRAGVSLAVSESLL